METPSLGGLPTEAKELLLPMRHDYTPPDANLVFQGHEDIIIITINIIIIIIIVIIIIITIIIIII